LASSPPAAIAAVSTRGVTCHETPLEMTTSSSPCRLPRGHRSGRTALIRPRFDIDGLQRSSDQSSVLPVRPDAALRVVAEGSTAPSAPPRTRRPCIG
jgi:hypothetical protein